MSVREICQVCTLPGWSTPHSPHFDDYLGPKQLWDAHDPTHEVNVVGHARCLELIGWESDEGGWYLREDARIAYEFRRGDGKVFADPLLVMTGVQVAEILERTFAGEAEIGVCYGRQAQLVGVTIRGEGSAARAAVILEEKPREVPSSPIPNLTCHLCGRNLPHGICEVAEGADL